MFFFNLMMSEFALRLPQMRQPYVAFLSSKHSHQIRISTQTANRAELRAVKVKAFH